MLPSRQARAFAVALLAALLGALLPATAVEAASRTVQGGRLDWGIKSSFQSYVTGSVAKGSWSLTGGAATVGGSQFRFHSATGSYDPDSGALNAGFSGGVHFTGHKNAAGGHDLDLTISRPTVRISGGSGTLYADMVSKDKATGKVTTSAQVPLASLTVSGINMKGGGSPVALNSIPATLTSQGAKAFAGYYAAGAQLDPVSLSADVVAAAATKAPADKADKGDKKEQQPKTAGAFHDAAVDWGVRRTFREYVTGSIARGKWELTDGAQDGGALFRFPKGKGAYDEKKRTLDADFAGRLRFTGKHLDLTLSGVAVTVKDGKGTLAADVTSETDTKTEKTKKNVPLVTFEAKELAPKDGLVTLTEAPAKLTERGAKAFGSMYRAGTAMDPVSLAVALDKKAQLPALPDLGSDARPSAEPEKKAEKKAAAKTRTAATASSSRTGTYIAIGAGVLLSAAIALYLAHRRRTTQN
ncbi:HtaA domain-containing protein [Streptomyces spiramyceticus]|uniref:HtaA domain-containing protein n=1 Tax=Streptomyces spiramyceticus TaxID=299717 RepID=UPI00237A5A99|nr:HtaA domain-containing protein [Streptomyces spiramyceticus]